MSKSDTNISDVMVLLEDMNGKFDFMLEIIASTKERVDAIPLMQLEMSQMKSDIKVIKAAAITTNKTAREHENRLRRLETNPA